MRATFSPAMARICSPAVRSVVSISANAVESHAASGRPDRFLKPSTAIDRRGDAPTVAADEDDGLLTRLNFVTSTAPMTPRTTIASAANNAARVPSRSNRPVAIVATVGLRNAAATSAADDQRSAGRLARHFVTTLASAGDTSGSNVRSGAGCPVRIDAIVYDTRSPA